MCSRNKSLSILYTWKVCTTLSLKLLSITRSRLELLRVCAGRVGFDYDPELEVS
jgi:hypothetical protein